VDKVIKGYLH